MQQETQRLLLREFSASDFEDVHAYSSDYETVRHMMFGPNTPEQTRDYLERQIPAEMTTEPRMHYNFAIQRRDSGRVIGGVSFHMNWRRDDAILGAVLNRREAGQGFMTEAVRGVCAIAFEQLGLHRLHAVCDVDNGAMLRVLEKCGFRCEGRMVQRGKSRPEEKNPYFDQFGYAMLRSEWLARRDEEQ
ncbi:MAG: GNAT family N-acetyltransferase [Clostridiales bacterium]|nr:GNAT family N-acetyltransferase [Clostridiales bacterium]